MKDINSFIKKFTDDDLGEIILYKNKYYFKNKMVDKIEREPFAPGIPLGDNKKDFRPSVYLLELLSKKTENKIFVNDKAEWLFLCGRDVFEKSIVTNESVGKTFLVQNLNDENIGLGKKVSKGKRLLVKNVIDRGDFLRREK